jgi:hypothetical protein
VKALFFSINCVLLLPEQLITFCRKTWGEQLPDHISIFFELLREEVVEDVLFYLKLVRISQHIPVVQVLVVGVKFGEKRLEEFFIAEQDVFDVLLIANEVARRDPRDLLPKLWAERGRKASF